MVGCGKSGSVEVQDEIVEIVLLIVFATSIHEAISRSDPATLLISRFLSYLIFFVELVPVSNGLVGLRSFL